MSDDLKHLRHGMRGILNAMSLGVCALELGLSAAESVDFLSDIARGAEELTAMLDRYEPLFEAAGAAAARAEINTGERGPVADDRE